MSDNMPGVKSVRGWSLELTEIILSGDDVQIVDSKVTEILNAGRRKGMTEAVLECAKEAQELAPFGISRRVINKLSARIETARDNIK